MSCSPTGTMRIEANDAAHAGLLRGASGNAKTNEIDRYATSPADKLRLDELWRHRSADSASDEDYPIGPGDVLTASVPSIEELQGRKTRVSAKGTIELPLVGIVEVGGLTEDRVAQELDKKLGRFMFDPQASVFVEEYRNREVALVGAVNKPGLVLLDSPTETILDVLTQAGGVTSTAADDLILIPSEQGGKRQIRSAALPQSPHSHNSPEGDTRLASAYDSTSGGHPAWAVASNAQNDAIKAMAIQDAHPISISLRSTSLAGSGHYLNLPVRPGDVIVVPGGGEVMVVGWVQTPGHFVVGSGLTVLGAIGEAGGPMYAADTKEVTLIRSAKDGSKKTVALDLEAISRGHAQDVAVMANDVIDVPYSGWRIGPYIFYSVITRIGLAGPAIPY
jgi:protein involved in polysaccharide export with SLBB domain